MILKSFTLYNKCARIKRQTYQQIRWSSFPTWIYSVFILSPHGNLDLELYEGNVAILDWVLKYF